MGSSGGEEGEELDGISGREEKGIEKAGSEKEKEGRKEKIGLNLFGFCRPLLKNR